MIETSIGIYMNDEYYWADSLLVTICISLEIIA